MDVKKATKMKNQTISGLEAELGQQIRALRLSQGADQRSLAGASGVALSALKNLESGKGAALKTLIRVLKALGRADWLATLAVVDTTRQRTGRPRKIQEKDMKILPGIARTLSTPRPVDISPEELQGEIRRCATKSCDSSFVRALFEEIPISTLHEAILGKELNPRRLLQAARNVAATGEARDWLEEYCHG